MANWAQLRTLPALDRAGLFAIGALLLLVVLTAVVGPQGFFLTLVALAGIGVVVLRPVWGVGTLLVMFLVTYGQPIAPGGEWVVGRFLTETFGRLITGQAGLLTFNNVLGLVLMVSLAYRVYRESDWSFIQSPQVLLVGLITGVLILSAYLNAVDYGERALLGLPPPRQDPRRLIISRLLFLALFVAFVRAPQQLRTLVGVFLALSLATAASGFGATFLGAGFQPPREEIAGYRAGGAWAIIGAAGNPNRLALFCTLTIALIWEYGQSLAGRRWTWLISAATVMLVLVVFATASRQGVIGLAATGLLLFARRRAVGRTLVYGLLVALIASVFVGQLVPEESLERLSTVPGVSDDPAGTGRASIERRRYTLQIGLKLATENPFLGVGVDNWGVRRYLEDPLRTAGPPHNSYLLALVEGGSICLFLYLILFFSTVRRLGEMERRSDVMERVQDDGVDWILSGTRLCLLSYMVFSLFADLWELIVFYFLIGMAGVLINMYGRPQRRPAIP